eukprot:766415-Rhodomonas_salina.1
MPLCCCRKWVCGDCVAAASLSVSCPVLRFFSPSYPPLSPTAQVHAPRRRGTHSLWFAVLGNFQDVVAKCNNFQVTHHRRQSVLPQQILPSSKDRGPLHLLGDLAEFCFWLWIPVQLPAPALPRPPQARCPDAITHVCQLSPGPLHPGGLGTAAQD